MVKMRQVAIIKNSIIYRQLIFLTESTSKIAHVGAQNSTIMCQDGNKLIAYRSALEILSPFPHDRQRIQANLEEALSLLKQRRSQQ